MQTYDVAFIRFQMEYSRNFFTFFYRDEVINIEYSLLPVSIPWIWIYK